MPLPRPALAALLALAACTQVPELGDVVPPDLRAADYPALIPLDTELTAPADPAAEAERLSGALNARADRLKRRARELSARTVVDDTARARMDAGVTE
ncbi:hypothetical protein [Seohaeicola zhoushanensis]|uniref:Uncharacterized protein n=1 Tax=Seohaeicola zhoushanensis TaxID=1569283 RepID=A0A8J3GZI2_9RHOB|nr:hypothetical protein [Seohaeicola zhoushanensis]GHF61554.1 hypothetical protein GCM10017056_36240 [Seohaeicola zhoushanensis]